MSSDRSDMAPPLSPEDLSLESSLCALRPRSASPYILDRLLCHLECAAVDDMAASSPDPTPMPLDASLLAFENELRALRPLDMDFPTGQHVLMALEREMVAITPPALSVLPATGNRRPNRRWTPAMPWAAAAALVTAGWIALPYLPRSGGSLAHHTPTGLIPVVTPEANRGSVALVFPVTPRNQIFSPPGGQPVGIDPVGRPAPRVISIPEATSLFGLLDVECTDLPPEFLQSVGLDHGVSIQRVGPSGPAHAHGLIQGDIILRLNGAPVSLVEELSVMIRNSKPGATVNLRVLRGRETLDVPVRLGAAPSA